MSTFTLDYVTYTLNSGDLTASVTGNALQGVTNVTIPPSITNGNVIYTVTSIGNQAFNRSSHLASIVIPETVTSIANGSPSNGAFFQCSALTAVTIGANVTTIGIYAFQGCSALTAVTIGANVTSIGSYAFGRCSKLTAVTIPNAVTSIGSNAFSRCSELTAVIIPDAVTSIGESAFYNCSKLTAVIIGASVTTIGDYAFYGCSALTAVTISSGNTAFFNGSNGEVYQISGSTVALFFCPRNITSFTIPDSVTDNGSILYTVTSIGSYAFEQCSALTAVTIGANVTRIGDDAFQNCSALTAVIIPDAVTSIGNNAFAWCSELTAVIIGSGLTTMGGNAFEGCGDTLTSMYFLGDYPSGIDGTTFYGDNSLTLYYLDDASNWSSIVGGKNAVAITAGITGVASITAFSNSNKTATFSIADNSYTNVELVVLNGDSGVTSGKAFAKSVDGTNWTVTSPALVNGDVVKVFLQTSSGATVTQLLSYSYDSTSTYYSVDLGVGIVSIGDGAFQDCSALTAVTIGANVTSIGNNAFNGCIALTAVIIGSSVTTIGNHAFQDCSALTAVTIPDAVTSIGINAFTGCSALTAVIIGASVISIGSNAFMSCTVLTVVTIPDAVTSIGDGAFQNCSALTSLPVSPNNTVLYNDPNDNGVIYQISNGVASLYLSVPTKVSYEMLSTIQNVNVTSVHSYAFFYDASLSHIVLSDSITQIGERAFQICTGLSNVVIPASVTTIGTGAFVSDSALDSVYFLGDKPSTIDEYAFSDIKNPSTAYYLSSNANSWGTTPDGFTYLETFTISDLRVAGYTASELQTLGVADSDILGAEYSATQLQGAGYTIADLQGAGYTDSAILGAGYSATDLQGAGYTIADLQGAGYTDSAILGAGYSATQLQGAGYTIADLQGAGYTDSAILGAGYSATDLQGAGYTIADLQGAGYTASAILGAGYTATQLQGAGYTIADLQGAGYTDSAILGAGYSAILGAGYSAAQLAAAGFYLISGTATGLSLGATFVLTLVINGDSVETKTIQATTSANNDFYFSNYVSSGSDYSVSATSSGKTATITNGSGTISTSNIINISIAFADNSTPTTPSSNVCFPAKTPILTNCGPINIEDINPAVHTIRNKKIVAITKTVAHDKNLVRIAKHALGHLYPEKTTFISQNHKVFFQGQMVKAKHLVDEVKGVTFVPYNGQVLYNVLLEEHEKMQVNNLIVETLHPEHKVAKLYRFLKNVDAAHHGKMIALFNQKDREQRLRR